MGEKKWEVRCGGVREGEFICARKNWPVETERKVSAGCCGCVVGHFARLKASHSRVCCCRVGTYRPANYQPTCLGCLGYLQIQFERVSYSQTRGPEQA